MVQKAIAMAGRPTKFTPENTTRILNALRGGTPIIHAAQAAAVDYSTFCRWRQRGERVGHGPYREFCNDVKRAEADSIIRNVTIVQKAAIGGEVISRTTTTKPDGTVVVRERMSIPVWQAAAWWLERKYPDEWSRKERVEHTAPQGSPIGGNFILVEDRVGPRSDKQPDIEV